MLWWNTLWGSSTVIASLEHVVGQQYSISVTCKVFVVVEHVVGQEFVAEGAGLPVEQDPSDAEVVPVVAQHSQQVHQQTLACAGHEEHSW